MGFGVLSMALLGASCNSAKKDPVTTAEGPKTDAPKALRPDAAHAQEEDLPGVELGGLSPDEQQQFFRLVDAAPSPCGKAQSLRASVKSDSTCKRAPFAARYVRKLSTMGGEDEELLEAYKKRYVNQVPHAFDVAGAPYAGVPDAPVKIVEFFDYSCPHCKLALPLLEDVVARYPSDVVIYFLHFPLGGAGHPNSMFLARASVAAMRQGKFREMHKKLFALQDKGDQSEPTIKATAKELGLDMNKFETDYNDPKTTAFIEAQRKQAEKAEIDGTPAIYINDKTYTDWHELEFLKSWIDEELAVKK
jgi:protein-disulfide isomerase